MGDFGPINNGLKKAAKKGSASFLESFLGQEDKIVSLLSKFSGIKSELYLQRIDQRLTIS